MISFVFSHVLIIFIRDDDLSIQVASGEHGQFTEKLVTAVQVRIEPIE